MVAILLIPLLGMLALTVDVSYAYGQRRLAQNVADSAALNAAVVVGKRLQAPSETFVKDADVVDAISVVAARSSGGYVFGPKLVAEYVKWVKLDGSIAKVGDVGTGVSCTTVVATGCIPYEATGVRIVAQTTFNTFFAPILNQMSLTTGARATALNETVTRMNINTPGVAPYALWTGENGPDGDGDSVTRKMQDNSAPPDFLCRDAAGIPQLLKVGGSYVDATAGSYMSTGSYPPGMPAGKAFDYSCKGGTNTAIPLNTVFIIRAAPAYGTPNVSVGNPNYDVGSSNFKGFIRIEDPNGFFGPGDYVSDGGIAGGAEDSGMDIIHKCYLQPCTLVMPYVSYARDDASSGHPQILVSGFISVQVSSVNSQDPTTAPSSYQWKAKVINAPVTCCPVASTPEVVPGSSALLYTKLYE